MSTEPSAGGRSPFRQRRALKIALVGLIGVVMLLFTARFWWLARHEPSAAAAPSPTPPLPADLAPDAVTNPPFTSLTYAIHTFLWWNEATRASDLYFVRLMNFSHVKQRFSWKDMEPAPGEWHWDHADAVVQQTTCQRIGIIARLDGPPDWAVQPPSDDPTAPPVKLDAWGEFCGTIAGRYKGQIAGYQVWNEPNLRREWGDRPPNAQGYVQLLQACSAAIHQADPDAVVISAGLAPTGTTLPDAIPDMDYLRQMYAAGAAPWFDVLGLNAPGYADPPELSPDEAAAKYDGYRFWVFRHVEDMRAIMVQQGDAAKQVALLEVGWTTDTRPDSSYNWHAVSEEQQADYLVRAYRWAAEHWRPWVGLMVTIYLADPEWTPDNEEYWWAVDTPGYPPHMRPAYFALANMERYQGTTFTPARDPSSPDAVAVEPIEGCE